MKNTPVIIQWILSVIITLFALKNGAHFSSLFLLVSAFLLMPIEPIREKLAKIKIKTFVTVILSVIFLFLGTYFSPKLCAEPAFASQHSQTYTSSLTKDDNTTVVSNTFTSEKPQYIESFSSNISEVSSAASEISSVEISDVSTSSTETSDCVSEIKIPNAKDQVYRTPHGKSYHLNKNCGGKNSYPVTLGDAVEDSLSPCKKCAGSSNISSSENTSSGNSISNGKQVYRTPNGKRYHSSRDCGGENSYAVNIDTAKQDGLTPCKKCIK